MKEGEEEKKTECEREGERGRERKRDRERERMRVWCVKKPPMLRPFDVNIHATAAVALSVQ